MFSLVLFACLRSEYVDRVASVREKGADVKRRLEEMREARRAKIAKSAESSSVESRSDQAAAPAAAASRAPPEWNDMLDWKSKAIAGRAAPSVAASFAAFDAEQQ